MRYLVLCLVVMVGVSNASERWKQHYTRVPKAMEAAVAMQESGNKAIGLHPDSTSIGRFGITPVFVKQMIAAGWIPNQKYDLYNNWENRWLFRRGMEYLYHKTGDWRLALKRYHGSKSSYDNEVYVYDVYSKM